MAKRQGTAKQVSILMGLNLISNRVYNDAENEQPLYGNTDQQLNGEASQKRTSGMYTNGGTAMPWNHEFRCTDVGSNSDTDIDCMLTTRIDQSSMALMSQQTPPPIRGIQLDQHGQVMRTGFDPMGGENLEYMIHEESNQQDNGISSHKNDLQPPSDEPELMAIRENSTQLGTRCAHVLRHFGQDETGHQREEIPDYVEPDTNGDLNDIKSQEYYGQQVYGEKSQWTRSRQPDFFEVQGKEGQIPAIAIAY